MKRKITDRLIKWKNEGCKKPYMIIGARQVGKTYSVDEFCRLHFEEYLYINLERDQNIRTIFDQSLDPEVIIKQISLLKNKVINVDSTVIFIDEIQLSERAITSLKYFSEQADNYKIIVAGSLLGVALNRFKSSFPVGKVSRYYLQPMDFEEFLIAIKEEDLSEEIKRCYHLNQKMFESVHEKLMGYYKDYIFVGGMPESILSYINSNRNLNHYSRETKRDIIEDYLADMNKYTSNSEALKIKQVFQSIPSQLGRDNNKFSYKIVSEKGKKVIYGTSIEWLISSNLVNRATLVEVPRIPLKTYHKENMFKIYLGDTGLLCELADMSAQDIYSSGSQLFSGMITENYVAQTLVASDQKLYYWRSGNIAEVDFLINVNGEIIPVEVKASTNTKSKALNTYIKHYEPSYAIKISGKNFGFSGGIKSVPLYAAHLVGRLDK